MTVDEIRETLREYMERQRDIEMCEAALRSARETMDSTAIILDGMPHGTETSDRTGRLAAQLIDMENDWVERKIEAVKRQREIFELFNAFKPSGIKEHNAKKVIYWRYIKGKSAKATAEELDFDLSYIHALTSVGLERLAEVTKDYKK